MQHEINNFLLLKNCYLGFGILLHMLIMMQYYLLIVKITAE